MKKLIELIKIKDWYEDVCYKKQSDWWYMFWLDGNAIREERMCGKKFWFIKWLVNNNKIDYNKVLISFTMSESDWLWNYYWHWVEAYQGILMLLAISDTPIDDLISYLE